MNKNVLNSKKKIPAKILIVEDEMIVAKDMQETLKSKGYAVTAIVNSGRDAIKEAKKEQPDLILMDIVLKGKMDGIETAKRIHKDFDIPIIFITAFSSNKILQRAKAAKPYAYITKPFDNIELYTNIEIALHKHQANKELQETERQFRTIFENATDGILIVNAKTQRFHIGNPKILQMLGYNLDELKKLTVSDIHPKEHLPHIIEQLEKQMRREIELAQNIPVQRKDRSVFFADINSTPIQIEGTTYLMGFFRDITQQRHEKEEHKRLMHDMYKRIKELQCMYGIIRSSHSRKKLEDVLKDVTVIIPTGWQYPEITRAKICYKYRIFRTLPFRETRWKQTSPIIIDGKKQGSIEVYYTKSRPKLDEGPFTKEERHLLDNITKTLSEAIEHKQMEKRIIQLTSFPEKNPIPVIETDLNGNISYLNPAAKDRFPDIISEGLNNPILKDIINVVETIKNHGNDSLTREVEVNNSIYEEKICYFPASKLARIFVYEITQRKKMETDLRKQSLIDQLTGLYNRRGFFTMTKRQVQLADRAKKGFYILFADLDKMKWINDNLGHHEGDIALQAVAAICRNSFRKSDIIGRLGGDEFAICAVEAKKDSAELFIKRLRKNFDTYNKKQKHDYKLSLSIGTTYYDPSNPCSIDELLEQADKLMYKQKIFKQSPRVTTIEPKEIALDKPSRTEYVLKSDIVKVLLIADDIQISQSVKDMIKETNTHRFEVVHVATLSTGLKHLGSEIVDVVLLDLNLKHRRYFEVFKKVYAQAQGVPIIVLIDSDTENLAVKAIREGAQDCLVKSQIDSNLLVRSIKYAIERGYTVLELKNSFGKFQKALEDTINTLAAIVEMRDPYTAGHQKRVSELAQAIAKEMNLTEDQIKGIKMAALIHDVGKTQVPEDILNKATKLSEIEMKIVKTHPGTGYEILKTIKFPWLITQIVHQHHERMNGSGYPMGITDKDILLESKILAVADVIEAMSSDRPYRPAPGIEKALEEITQNKSKLYDPDVVDTCIKLFKNKDFKFASGVKSYKNAARNLGKS